MPPKVKITKEDILDAATELARQKGASAINARDVAAALNCSTQPVFSNFATMELLRCAVLERADRLCTEYIQREIRAGTYPEYKASGMAYIRFAREERELFKFLYMRDRQGDNTVESPTNTQMTDLVHRNTGLEDQAAQLFHMEMWAFVHGIATMFATGFMDPDWDLVSKMLTDAYQGLRKQYTEGDRL